MGTTVEMLVERAKEGDKDALEEVIRKIQDRVYGLAIRMLYYPADAEDATQEILVKIITHLDSFRGESAFTSWVYRIASNHLLTTQKCHVESIVTTFANFEEIMDKELAESSPATTPEPEQALVIQEIMIGCTMGMLICLDRNLRIAYIMGAISGIKSDNASHILNITPVAFRKRLSRARTLLKDFMQKRCGLVNPDNPCRCHLYVNQVINAKGKDSKNLLFAGHPCLGGKETIKLEQLQELKELQRIAVIFRSHPEYAAPESLVEKFRLFGEQQ